MKAHFILNKSKVKEQYDKLKSLCVNVSYSVKTNKKVGEILVEENDCEFSVHNLEETKCLEGIDTKRVWYFSQAWNFENLEEIFSRGIRKFVVDNEEDLKVLLKFVGEKKEKIWLSLRMRFAENRIVTGKYFVYGLESRRVNELIKELKGNSGIGKLGVHVHRKSQNVSEWNIKRDIEWSLGEEELDMLDFFNLGGGYPIKYRNFTSDIEKYIFGRIKEVKDWLGEKGIDVYVEPGRFISAPAIKLVAEIIQVSQGNLILNCSVYNSDLDSLLTDIRLLVEGELDRGDEGNDYLIKGCTPTRDDIFRYRVRLSEKKVGDQIVFLNAGAYNYKCEFCDLEELETKVE